MFLHELVTLTLKRSQTDRDATSAEASVDMEPPPQLTWSGILPTFPLVFGDDHHVNQDVSPWIVDDPLLPPLNVSDESKSSVSGRLRVEKGEIGVHRPLFSVLPKHRS